MDEKSTKSKKIIFDILILIIGLSIGYAIIFFALGLGEGSYVYLFYSSEPDDDHSEWKIFVPTEEVFQKYPELKELLLTRNTSINLSNPDEVETWSHKVPVKTRQRCNELREFLYHKIFYWEGEYYTAAIPME
ncbi:hypothetical protein [Methanocorpusculum parvum]|uniref:Uncharacterized protein n=1 Tax=Methanocorpusculum parvum TaxID=2193 RepID=A0AAX0Q6W2_9EURY|nr:hypothetical protein [Methanocorpusculum parvum]PAV09016.1 hypothetical protein ASJ83_08480 [Methanocorpusculum parvum]